MEINEENIGIRKRLINLPKLKASENFQTNLQNKIKQLALDEKQANSAKNLVSETGVFQKIFGNKRKPWLVPAFGLAVVAILAFSVIFIINKDNPVNKLPDVTVTKESAPVLQEQTKSNTVTDNLKKEELSGKEITEDYSSKDNSTDINEQKYTDQGSKPRLKSENVESSDKKAEVKGLISPPSEMESRSVESKGDVGRSKINEQEKSEKKVADSESKNADEKVAKSEKSKKDDKEIMKENKQDVKSLQTGNDIDKKVLQSLKDKIEKASSKNK